jgi:prepilin-type N-terminal cleavage/methylation domain-containing protein/prepilin-type processing-associated H-X9-DG protein
MRCDCVARFAGRFRIRVGFPTHNSLHFVFCILPFAMEQSMSIFSHDRARRLRAFTLVELLVVIAIIGILVALLLPAIQAAREAARRAQCQSNMHNVALAVLNFESSNKRLPKGMTFDAQGPGNTNGMDVIQSFGPNWIIDILPYMEEQALRDKFNPGSLKAPFNPTINDKAPDPTGGNQYARSQIISSILCASDPNNRILYQGGRSGAAAHGPNWGRTNYAASAGRAFFYASPPTPYFNGPDGGAAWNAKDATAVAAGVDYTCQRGVMGPNASVTLRQISDGTNKTIMIGEIRAGLQPNDSRGVWALGGASASIVTMYGSNGDDNGPNACFLLADDAYGDPEYVSSATGKCPAPPNPPPQGWNECMTISNGGAQQQGTVRSTHPGGAFLAMCDGHVEFVSNDIDTGAGCYSPCCTVWDYMILSADGGREGVAQAGTGRGAPPGCN